MALKKAKIITITSVAGGTGKTTTALCAAGIYSSFERKVLIIDLDLYKGTIAASLNLDVKSDMFILVNDLNNNKFKRLDEYVTSYNENIDVLPAVKDPRYANKINASYLQLVLDKYCNKYDLIIVDTADDLSPFNLVTFDYSDLIIYVVNNDAINLKNMRTMVAIFDDMGLSKYKIFLNEANRIHKNYFTKNDMKNIIKANIDYTVPSKFFIRNIDKYFVDGVILTLDKGIRSRHKKEILHFEEIAKEIYGDVEKAIEDQIEADKEGAGEVLKGEDV